MRNGENVMKTGELSFKEQISHVCKRFGISATMGTWEICLLRECYNLPIEATAEEIDNIYNEMEALHEQENAVEALGEIEAAREYKEHKKG